VACLTWSGLSLGAISIASACAASWVSRSGVPERCCPPSWFARAVGVRGSPFWLTWGVSPPALASGLAAAPNGRRRHQGQGLGGLMTSSRQGGCVLSVCHLFTPGAVLQRSVLEAMSGGCSACRLPHGRSSMRSGFPHPRWPAAGWLVGIVPRLGPLATASVGLPADRRLRMLLLLLGAGLPPR